MMTRFKMWHRVLLISVIAGLLLLIVLLDDQPNQKESVVNEAIKDFEERHNVRAQREVPKKDSHAQMEKVETLTKEQLHKSRIRSTLEFEKTHQRNTSIFKDPGLFDGLLNVKEQYKLGHIWGGYLFNDKGRVMEISAEVETSLVHSFSPYIERETAKRFVDPPHNQVYFANSPAVKWHNGELVLVARMWLDRERYEPKESWPPNHFADNWLYTQKYNRELQPVNSGAIMGIPLPKQWWVGDGPIEPRLFRVQGRLFISFNAAMSFTAKQSMDFTIMYDYDQNMPIIPKIKGGTPMKNATEKDDMPRDKHWMALIQNDELYFVHNLDPLRVMKCTLEGDCEFVHNEKDRTGFIFEHHVSHLRGGTPFEPYEGEYYISVAHSTMYKTSNHHRYYAAHLIVLRATPASYRVVFVSNGIKIHKKIYELAPMVRPRWIEDGFIFPVGLLVENRDSIVLGVHVNDFSSVLIRLNGLERLMTKIIREDKLKNANINHGPPIGYLQQHIHDVMQNITHLGFVH